jgi:hypothetical protein
VKVRDLGVSIYSTYFKKKQELLCSFLGLIKKKIEFTNTFYKVTSVLAKFYTLELQGRIEYAIILYYL